jgi:hypothetical protein
MRGRIMRRLLHQVVTEPEWNRQLPELKASFEPDLVYITNAHYCWPQTLATIRRRSIPTMCSYHDPPWQDRPWSRFGANISHSDLVATTRRWHKPEFEAAGAGKVLAVRFGFEPTVHRPVSKNRGWASGRAARLTCWRCGIGRTGCRPGSLKRVEGYPASVGPPDFPGASLALSGVSLGAL